MIAGCCAAFPLQADRIQILIPIMAVLAISDQPSSKEAYDMSEPEDANYFESNHRLHLQLQETYFTKSNEKSLLFSAQKQKVAR